MAELTYRAKYGPAFVLTKPEYQAFRKRYLAVHPEEIDRIDDKDYRFLPSDGIRKPFRLQELNARNGKAAESAQLVPYMAGDPEAIVRHYGKEPLYVLWAEKQMDSLSAFTCPPYQSIGILRYEISRKVGRYLPDDLDLASHIGSFCYIYPCLA